MSQLEEKSGEKFLSENDPGDNNPTTPPHYIGEGDKSDDSQCIDEAVSHSLTGSDEKISGTPSLREGHKWVFWRLTVHQMVL